MGTNTLVIRRAQGSRSTCVTHKHHQEPRTFRVREHKKMPLTKILRPANCKTRAPDDSPLYTVSELVIGDLTSPISPIIPVL